MDSRLISFDKERFEWESPLSAVSSGLSLDAVSAEVLPAISDSLFWGASGRFLKKVYSLRIKNILS
jgi:hypothetical protein